MSRHSQIKNQKPPKRGRERKASLIPASMRPAPEPIIPPQGPAPTVVPSRMAPDGVGKIAYRLVERPPGDALLNNLINCNNTYLRTYEFGPLSVIVTKEYGRWHFSVVHPYRYPTWDELVAAKYALAPDVPMSMKLPAEGEYINIHKNCFQLFEDEAACRDEAEALIQALTPVMDRVSCLVVNEPEPGRKVLVVSADAQDWERAIMTAYQATDEEVRALQGAVLDLKEKLSYQD